MSSVARIFVVLNLVLAVAFLVAASTFLGLNNDYKAKYEAEKSGRAQDDARHAQQLSDKDSSLSKVSTDLNTARQQAADQEARATNLQSQVTSLEAAGKTKDGQLADLTRANGEHAGTIERLRADNNRLVAANTDLDAKQREAVSRMEKAVSDLDGEKKNLLEANNNIANLEKDVVKLKDDVSNRDLLVEFAKSKGIDFENVMVMAPVKGQVVNADNNLKLVQANVGSNQGVKRGWILDIVRGGTYVGRFRVDTVGPTYCAGMVTLLADGQQVAAADVVTNTLN
jgi:DNA repair exonuclease SbcCD ATPase subunit